MSPNPKITPGQTALLDDFDARLKTLVVSMSRRLLDLDMDAGGVYFALGVTLIKSGAMTYGLVGGPHPRACRTASRRRPPWT